MSAVCKYDTCDRAGKLRRGYCDKHYRRFLKHGDPGKTLRASTALVDGRSVGFWQQVAITANPDRCWEWQGGRNVDGYGVRGTAKGRRKWKFAHRLAYYLFNQQDPGPLCVLHRCDNPACCNPHHLFLGTRAVNNLDRTRKGRSNRWVNHKHPGKKVDSVLAEMIRNRWSSGEKQATIASDLNLSVSSVNRAVRGVI